MASEAQIKQFLSNDDALTLLKTVDMLNPAHISPSKCCNIKTISSVMGKGLKDTWNLVNQGLDCGLLMTYGGILSRRRVDLTDVGERFCECTTANEIKMVINDVKD